MSVHILVVIRELTEILGYKKPTQYKQLRWSDDIFQKSMPTVYFRYDVNRRRSFKVLERHAIFNSIGNRVLSRVK